MSYLSEVKAKVGFDDESSFSKCISELRLKGWIIGENLSCSGYESAESVIDRGSLCIEFDEILENPHLFFRIVQKYTKDINYSYYTAGMNGEIGVIRNNRFVYKGDLGTWAKTNCELFEPGVVDEINESNKYLIVDKFLDNWKGAA